MPVDRRARRTGPTGNLLAPSQTRWTGDSEMLESLLKHKKELEEMQKHVDNASLRTGTCSRAVDLALSPTTIFLGAP